MEIVARDHIKMEFSIDNVEILGLEETIRASGFPMRTDLEPSEQSGRLTGFPKGLASSNPAHGVVTMAEWSNALDC